MNSASVSMASAPSMIGAESPGVPVGDRQADRGEQRGRGDQRHQHALGEAAAEQAGEHRRPPRRRPWRTAATGPGSRSPAPGRLRGRSRRLLRDLLELLGADLLPAAGGRRRPRAGLLGRRRSSGAPRRADRLTPPSPPRCGRAPAAGTRRAPRSRAVTGTIATNPRPPISRGLGALGRRGCASSAGTRGSCRRRPAPRPRWPRRRTTSLSSKAPNRIRISPTKFGEPGIASVASVTIRKSAASTGARKAMPPICASDGEPAGARGEQRR